MPDSNKLLKAKINNIEVIFLESLKLKVTNNYEEKRQVSKDRQTKKKEGSGAVDLGFGTANYSFKCHALKIEDTNQLTTFLLESREVEITDPYLGKLKAFIQNAEIENSESHINQSYFTVDCILLYADWAPTPNYVFKIKDIKKIEQNKLNKDILKLKDEINNNNISLDKIGIDDINYDYIDLGFSYLEKGITNFVGNLTKVFSILGEPQNIFSRIRRNAINIKNIIDSITSLKDYPDNLYNSFLSTIDGIVDIFVPNKKKNVIETLLNKKKVSDIGYKNLSYYDRKKINLELYTNNIVNRIALLIDLEKIEKGGFKTLNELNNLVNSILSFFDYFEQYDEEYLDRETVTSISYMTKTAIINSILFNTNVYNVKEVTLDKSQSIIRYIYREYGDISNLDGIIKLNNLRIITYYQGKLKIFK